MYGSNRTPLARRTAADTQTEVDPLARYVQVAIIHPTSWHHLSSILFTMPTNPEARARETIDALLIAAGWRVQDREDMNLMAGRGVAVREFALKTGFADYLLFVDGKAIGAIEAKKEGTPLAGVEAQSAKYREGLPKGAQAWHLPMPFLYESTGVETYFTNGLDPDPRSRSVFAFHQPSTLVAWAGAADQFRAKLRHMPPLRTDRLWEAQIEAITNLERSLADDRPRALIQMATGSGKTFTAINFIYRLIKYGGAKRILFLVDRHNLGLKTLEEFQVYVTPDDGRKFTELYNVQLLQSNVIDDVSKVCITTIQRLYSMLSGEVEYDPANEERSLFETGSGLDREPAKTVQYNHAIPIDFFDVIVTDECHRSIYNLWRGVLEYFDAFLIGLTATPNKQTFGFFNQNLVMEYTRQRAVADGVNVDGQVYRIRTQITERGSSVEAGEWVGRRDRQTRRERWEALDDPLLYGANQLDRDVVAVDQIRTVIRTLRDKLPTDLFPGRTEVPKTLIFAKDDTHAEEIVRIVREEFGRGNDFCQKITYSVKKPSELIKAFRNAYFPRIAVTVDMIATGTDIKPLEVLVFMRMVQSSGLFEQMLGRGTRVISDTDLQAVTPDSARKTHFVIIDAVGVVENEKVDTGVLERKRSISFDHLLESVAVGARDDDTLSSLASRLARLEQVLAPTDRTTLATIAGLSGDAATTPARSLATALLDALDPDKATAWADEHAVDVAAARDALVQAAVVPFHNPALRRALVATQARNEQTIDRSSIDRVLVTEFDPKEADKLQELVHSFRDFLEQHKDEITALQLIFEASRARPNGGHYQRLSFADIRELSAKLAETQPAWTTEALWNAYVRLERNRVKGASARRTLTDVIALVRHTLELDPELVPYPDQVKARYLGWIDSQAAVGRAFTPDQHWWLDRIAEHIGVSLSVSPDDLMIGEFQSRGGLFKAREEFGDELGALLDELNAALVR